MSRFWKILLLLFVAALCGAAILATENVHRRRSAPPGRELLSVVNWQLSAFRAADFRGAYRHSAAGVQRKFSLVQFEQMVRSDYAAMIQAGKVELGAFRVDGGSAFAQVFLTTSDGTVHGYLYSFAAERDGWKIDGVQSLGIQSHRRGPGMQVSRPPATKCHRFA